MTGSYPPSTWNYYQHKGVTTNNHHVVKEELYEGVDDRTTAVIGKNCRKGAPKQHESLLKQKTACMQNLHDRVIELRKYMIRMGSLTSRYENRAQLEGMEDDEDEIDLEEFEDQDQESMVLASRGQEDEDVDLEAQETQVTWIEVT